MGIDTIAAFVDAVRQSRLLEPETLDELARRAPERFSDPRVLARHLIQKGRLTAFQVNQIFQGQGNGLALGNYVLLERLGEGGMGQVFKARHRSMGRVVALKVIRRDRLESADAIKRFRREIQAVAQLHHPNVVLAFDADAVGNTHFFVMEFVEGVDLSQMVKQKGPLPVGMACNFIRQTAEGLAHAHQKGMVHRDIKPSNLLVTRMGDDASSGSALVKILDLGLARLASHDLEDTNAASLSQDGAVVGTPDFMAPEQAKNSSKVDSRADLYSLGCTFYYLLSGQSPFAGGSNIEKLLKHQMDPPRPIEQFRSDVPEPVRVVLLHLLAKRPEDRFQTAGEVAAALVPFCDVGGPFLAAAAGNGRPTASANLPFVPTAGAVTAARPRAATPPPRREPPRWTPRLRQEVRKRWRVLAIAGAALLLLSGGLWMVKALSGPSSTNGKSTTASRLANTTPFSPRPTSTASTHPSTESGHKYLPDDTGLALAVNLPQLLKSSAGNTAAVRERLEIDLKPLKDALQFIGIDLFADVARLTVALVPGTVSDEVCLVFHGEFDLEKFRAAVARPGAPLQTYPVKGIAAARTYGFLDPVTKRPRYFGLVTPTVLVFSSLKQHVDNCFHRAAGRPTPKLSDEPVQTLMQNLDTAPTVHLVIGNTYITTKAGNSFRRQPLPVHSIQGNLRFGDDVASEIIVTASQPGAVETIGVSIRPLLYLILGSNEMLAPLISVLVQEEPVVNAKDSTVTLRHTFSARRFRHLLRKKTS